MVYSSQLTILYKYMPPSRVTVFGLISSGKREYGTFSGPNQPILLGSLQKG